VTIQPSLKLQRVSRLLRQGTVNGTGVMRQVVEQLGWSEISFSNMYNYYYFINGEKLGNYA
jgi:hypothetical protein